MKTIKKLMMTAVLAATAAISAPVSAATVATNGNLTANDPIFNSPNSGNPPTTTASGSFAYDVFGFTVNTAGVYDIAANSNAFDTYLGLYRGSFDPQSPLTNALQYDDDSGPGFNSLISRSLSTGTQYFAVVTSFAPEARGAYSLTFTGPGTATIGTGAVPEPATWAMMILGMGAVGFAMRSAKRRSDVKFDAKIKTIAAGALA